MKIENYGCAMKLCSNERSDVANRIPASQLERKENRERFWERGPHRKEREAHVLRPFQKRERFLAEDVQPACFLWFVSFARAKEMNE
ncbi:MAG: hypothetical protein IJM43_10745 [Bacteroidaceae bacterium]|nr:hypothetical protein [Bacteroidaceae bacterium]